MKSSLPDIDASSYVFIQGVYEEEEDYSQGGDVER
jgi:hypothetical protein